MKKYLSFFRIRFIAGLQYRAAAWAGVFTQAIWGVMMILMYCAFYENGSNRFPMDFQALSAYIWLQEALLVLFMAWSFDNEIFESITSGSVAYELCRPCDIYSMWFVKNVAMRLARVSLRCVPILIVAAFLPAPYGLTLPASPAAGVLFVISLAVGFLLAIAFVMLIYISAFYTISSTGIRILSASVVEFFSGALIPIPFYPEGLQRVLNLLPFASMQNTPFLIYTGYLGIPEAMEAMGIQLAWLVILVLTGMALTKHALGRVVIQGG